PYDVPHIGVPQVQHLGNAIFNAVPSGHVAWTLTLFWFARRYCGRFVQIATGLYLFFTILATLGFGQHYVVDLILSVPFAAAGWALCHKQWKWGAAAALAVLIWLVALRTGWMLAVPPYAVWLLCGATISVFALSEQSLIEQINTKWPEHLRMTQEIPLAG